MRTAIIVLLCILAESYGSHDVKPDAWIQENGARCFCPDVEYWKEEKKLIIKLDHLELSRIVIQVDGPGGESSLRLEIFNPKEYLLENRMEETK